MNHERRSKIFVVDAQVGNLDLLVEYLGERYALSVALDGESALEDIPVTQPDLILLDVQLPVMDGYAVCRVLKARADTAHIPVIFTSAALQAGSERDGFLCGGVDYISKPFDQLVVQARVARQLALVTSQRQLQICNLNFSTMQQAHAADLQRANRRIEQSHLDIIRHLGRAAEYRDNETGLHVERMSRYCGIMGRALGLDAQRVTLLEQAAQMHDVGKIGIPDHILLKPTKLTPAEWHIMRNHCEIGAAILGEHESPLLQLARTLALTHHEHWDGSGYPHGLQGKQIPQEGRIVAIADSFDVMTLCQSYRKGVSLDEAFETLQDLAGSQFDPELVVLFVAQRAQVEQLIAAWDAKTSPVDLRYDEAGDAKAHTVTPG
ncbi:response regulator receiver modulated metal dependent phosphohydrolase [Magnetococcus marinus MC-1]|uniref:Response regulator receiver modulated metal dependent phosphohydrolase n=1 Tax=Magnetococcus marinus (strain ATCC BAA-1437 / JCM 17883 / MC-1) TaxID=156889 RepID=A0LBU3_MAGMM|nr:HD domain-containing phosphohydrolase [Magnetococcus marinus]ABK45436.1 response regulator receiver modulated metal dependent phosphohydrolase [Magnetococcus marinus MC-1]